MDSLLNAGKAAGLSSANERESLTSMLVRAREQRLWISCNGNAKSPKEVKEKMDSGLYSDYSHVFSYVDPQDILMEMRASLRSLIDIKEEEIVRFEERISQASSDDPEAALRYLTVGKTFRFSDYKEPAEYWKWSSGWSDFMYGTDTRLGYLTDINYILRAMEEEKDYIICEIDVWLEPEPERVKVKISEILDRERLQMFYKDFNELKTMDVEAFNDFLSKGRRNNECWELLQKECNK